MSRSRWYQAAASVIREALEGQSPADEKAARALLKPHYPFGIREHLPYKWWCKAVRDEMARRFPQKHTPAADVFIARNLGTVWCNGCNALGKVPLGGCLLCCGLRAAWAETWCERGEESREGAFALANESEAEALILADFLDEHGWDELAAHFRGLHEPKPAKRRKRKGAA